MRAAQHRGGASVAGGEDRPQGTVMDLGLRDSELGAVEVSSQVSERGRSRICPLGGEPGRALAGLGHTRCLGARCAVQADSQRERTLPWWYR